MTITYRTKTSWKPNGTVRCTKSSYYEVTEIVYQANEKQYNYSNGHLKHVSKPVRSGVGGGGGCGSIPPDSPSWHTLTRSTSTPHLPIVNLPRNSVSDNQGSPPRDLPLWPHLVRLLFGSHFPMKKPGYGPE